MTTSTDLPVEPPDGSDIAFGEDHGSKNQVMEKASPPLSPLFQEALTYAARLHRGQRRKSSRTPYLGHLLGVASLVLECGGTETEAAAALLHDAVEDQGGRRVLEEIRDTFGPEVAAIVDGCTDAYTMPKPPWKERKLTYLESLTSASPSVQLVSLADKVHNARSLHRELVQHGPAIWNSFRGGKEGTLWYYRELVLRLEDAPCPYLAAEFKDLVDRLHQTAQSREQLDD